MKIKLFFLFFLIIPPFIFAQTSKNYSLKAEFIYGYIIEHTIHLENLVEGPVMGTELAIEWQTMGERPWHEYHNFPDIGVGLVHLDLGNPEMLGQLIAAYPYLSFNFCDFGFMELRMKFGMGLSYINKTFNNAYVYYPETETIDLKNSNGAVGSHLNTYLAYGGICEVPFKKGLTAIGEFNWNHTSNGSVFAPNSGLNMLNLSVGLKYAPNYASNYKPVKKDIDPLPHSLSFDLLAYGGARELYYKDNKMYPIGSVNLGIYRQMNNRLRLGIGVDGFYDGVYNGETYFKRTYITEDELENRIRVGVSLRPEFVFGKFIAGMHLGVYMYNPIKNLEPYDDAQTAILLGESLDKPLIYPYDIEEEDGWLYSSAILKYSITEHLLASFTLKTHLQKAEFIALGLGVKL